MKNLLIIGLVLLLGAFACGLLVFAVADQPAQTDPHVAKLMAEANNLNAQAELYNMLGKYIQDFRMGAFVNVAWYLLIVTGGIWWFVAAGVILFTGAFALGLRIRPMVFQVILHGREEDWIGAFGPDYKDPRLHGG